MDRIKIEKIYSSFKREEFVEFFKSIGSTEDDIVFIGDGWKALVHEEEKSIRFKLEFTSVRLELEINEDIYEEFTDSLRIAFLRGGG
jgi:hypothetical protein